MQSPAWEGDWPISQVFGINPAAYVVYKLAGHNGLDIAMPIGTELYAPIGGTIAEVANDPTGFGLYIKLSTPAGMDVLLAHLSNLYGTKAGDAVIAGTPLGRSGSTGNSTGPHLHFGWRLFNAPFYRGWPFNGYLDPRQWLDLLQGGSATL